jgi:hypothetical protein
VASLAAQGLLRRHYRPLIARDPRHRLLLRGWAGLHAFVQAATTPSYRKQFCPICPRGEVRRQEGGGHPADSGGSPSRVKRQR